MREILFRGKRVDDGEWFEGYYAKVNNYLTEKEEHIILPLDTTLYPPSILYSHTDISHYEVVDPKTVGQFTSLIDKNGNKVFEGDILAYRLEDSENETIDGVVKYGEFNCSCCDGVYGWYIEGGNIRALDMRKCYDDDERLYVIGNIHDNPELLEEKNNV